MVKFFSWNHPLEAQAAEISAGGIFLRTAEQLSEGALVTLRVALPGGASAFTVLARVVRTVRGGLLRKPGLALRFEDVAAPHRRSIAEYVDKRRPSLSAVT